jgi:hypothetical protein
MAFTKRRADWIDWPSTLTPVVGNDYDAWEQAMYDLSRSNPQYMIWSADDGLTYGKSSVTGLADLVNTDPAAVYGSAMAALASAPRGGTIGLLGPLAWQSVPSIPRNIANDKKIHTRGFGARVTLSSSGSRFADFTRIADGDNFRNYELTDLIVDGNNVASLTTKHVLLGNLGTGAWTSRVNFSNITGRRITVLNVPTGTSVNYQVVSFGSAHLASGESQTEITRILFEDCDFQGGNVGVAMLGTGIYTAGLGVNVWHDDITLTRVKHDTLLTPTVGRPDANFQIGGVGYGGTVRMTECSGSNSGDVTYEIDAIQDFLGVGCKGTDGWNAKFFNRNFRAPVAVASQKNTWRDCVGENVNIDRANRDCSDFEIGGDAATAGYIFGEMAILDCQTSDGVTTIPAVGGANISAQTVQFRKLTVRNLGITYSNLNVTGGGNSPVLIDIRSMLNGAVYDIDGVDWKLGGVRTGAGNNQWKMMRICGPDAVLNLRNVTVDAEDLTGMSSATDTFYWVGMAIDFASTVKARVDGFSFLTPAVGAHNVVAMAAGYTVGGNAFVIERLDTVKAPGGAGFDVQFNTAAQKTKTQIRRILTQRTAGSTSGPITDPVALTLVSGTPVALGSVTAGVSVIVQFLQGSGNGITSLDFSTNGGTTYTNLLTQAAGPMPAGACMTLGPLQSDALIKGTFPGIPPAAVAPTITLIPVP